MLEIDDAMAACKQERLATVDRARAQVDEVRNAGHPTEVLVGAQIDMGTGTEGDEEQEPKEPRMTRAAP